MNIMGPFIGVDGLQITDMAHDVEFVRNPVTAMDVARSPRHVERLAAIIPLNEGHQLGRASIRIHQPPRAKRRIEAKCNFRLHIGKFHLYKLF